MKQLPITNPATPRIRSLPLWIAGFVILLDQLSKQLVETAVLLHRSWTPFPTLLPQLRISHISNTGSAFGLFPNGSSIFAWTALIVSLAIVYYNFHLPGGQKLLRLALGLQLGGALGNLVDRLRIGHVTDFIDFGPWVFNVADAAIVSGAFLLAWAMWQESKQFVPASAEVAEVRNEGGVWDERPSN